MEGAKQQVQQVSSNFPIKKVFGDKTYSINGKNDKNGITLEVNLLHSMLSWKLTLNFEELSSISKFLIFEDQQDAFEFFERQFSSDNYQLKELEDLLLYNFEIESASRKKIPIQLAFKAQQLEINQIVKKQSEMIAAMFTEIQSLRKQVEELQHHEKVRQDKILKSKIVSAQEVLILRSWIAQNEAQKQNIRFGLIYRGTQDGFKAAPFHSKIAGKTHTLHLIETQGTQEKFGGFTSLVWPGHGGWGSNDLKAFVFSLTNNKKFVICNQSNVVYEHNQYLSTFGANHDFMIAQDANVNQSSYTNLGNAYGKNEGASARDLTKIQNFQVKEIEVYQVFY